MAQIYDKKTQFTIRAAKNIAKAGPEEAEARLASFPPEAQRILRPLVRGMMTNEKTGS